MKALILIALVISPALCAGASAQPKYTQAAICQIASQRGKYPQLVQIEADLFNGMPHGLFIGDTTCPRRKIRIDYKTAGAEPSVVSFDKYVLQNFAITGLIGHGRFCGSIKHDPGTGRIYLLLQTVLDFQPKWLPAERPGEPPTVTPPPAAPQVPAPDEDPLTQKVTVR